ncbi:chloride channel protein CLC-e isoform X2 [Cryptomeria japonica]|uniref:chloride channel protein CLC-e isoform X2 n=1 Tax=Cryptomeria japonica TaxID=3369 RepID=UPI0027DA3472|nr:chloride channel protein CLC-e isoform X2 [Cryptomeria japonica]
MAPVSASHHIFPIHFLYVSHHFSGISALTHSVKFKLRRPKKYPLHNCHLHLNYSDDYSYISHFAHRKKLEVYPFHFFPSKGNFRLNCSLKPADSVAENVEIQNGNDQHSEEGNPKKESQSIENIALAIEEFLPPEGFIVAVACIVGLLTGIAVVLFNLAVHEIRDLFWDGIPSSGASWLRDQTLEQKWKIILFTPACGGVVVAILNTLRNSLETSSAAIHMSDIKASFRSFLKTAAATVTLGTGNSLGPEGPSVEIGASIANGVGKVLRGSQGTKLSLVAAGSAAGISSGFNAPVAGCFFAVESVLWPSSADLSISLTNTTSMVILSAVIASVISQAGLGSDPAFTIPTFEFRSPADALLKMTGVPAAFLPPLGGISVGLIALAYPEVLYWGFENVDILLESQPFIKRPPVDLLLQLVGAKILATSLSRASGLVGGYYAPSLFIGAAIGSAYGKLASYAVSHADPMLHLDALEVASPQAYALVGMAAMLAGVCQVPLTSVLLLFELTRDYLIIIPLMAAVGFSSWISSSFMKEKTKKLNVKKPASFKFHKKDKEEFQNKKLLNVSQKPISIQSNLLNVVQSYPISKDKFLSTSNLCELESSLCVANQDFKVEQLEELIPVVAAMRTHYVTVSQQTSLQEAVLLILAEKEWCALVVDGNGYLKGILTLGDIQKYGEMARANDKPVEMGAISVSEVCSWDGGGIGRELLTVFPHTTLKAAQQLMSIRGLRQLPVVTEAASEMNEMGPLVGLLDRECINLACRAEITKRLLGLSSFIEDSETK